MIMTTPDEPLIYTSHGNLPASSLTYETAWEDRPEYTKFVERYKLGDEVVKESAHVYSRAVGVISKSTVGEVNG